jgi:predicted short-subunit dehydrogenase-like oxidoreductase (DUF2520 family)
MGRSLVHVAESLDVDVEFAWNRSRLEDDVAPTQVFGGVDSLVDAIERRGLRGGEVIWLTVSDDAIRPLAARLSNVLSDEQIVLHTCGSLEASVVRGEGLEAPTAGVHPLLAITDPEQAADRFGQAFWTVEGDDEAVRVARKIIDELGAEAFELTAGKRALYHAAAVLASNLEVALLDAAVEVADESGLQRDRAVEMLVTLASSALDNIDTDIGPDSVSGPAARGDSGTLDRHREALRAEGLDHILEIYERLTARIEDMTSGGPAGTED